MKTLKILGVAALLMGVVFMAGCAPSCSTGNCGAPAPAACGPCGY